MRETTYDDIGQSLVVFHLDPDADAPPPPRVNAREVMLEKEI